ncbi:hypothetical protein EU527_07260 [Candidatus Thorarchaeota archaeon]|nr:MAG: hypothetical protein EU527_07260 [Candidatus Thorarchaeota archaeon]
MQLPKRTKYAVKDLMSDLKKISPTPSIMEEVGSKLIYYEWTCCENLLSSDHPVTTNLRDLLDFMENEYENQLVTGELWRVADTPQSAINNFLKGRSKEFLDYTLDRSPEYIHDLLMVVANARKQEIKQYKQLEKNVRREIKEDSENPELWNKLRLLLWITKNYKEAADAFKTAKSFGWTSEQSKLVAL